MMIVVEEEAELSSWLGRTFFFDWAGREYQSSDEPESSAQRTS